MDLASESDDAPKVAGVAPVADMAIGNWAGALWLLAAQGLFVLLVAAVSWVLGFRHAAEIALAAAVVLPLVLLSYWPMFIRMVPEGFVAQVYLTMAVRMIGIPLAAVIVRQIATPLVSDIWLVYIPIFYLVGLILETTLIVRHLQARSRPGSQWIVGRAESMSGVGHVQSRRCDGIEEGDGIEACQRGTGG